MLATLFSGGCKSVAFYEKEDLGSSLMSLDDGGTQAHLQQKTVYSMEGSIGGIGSSAGGGCGCY